MTEGRTEVANSRMLRKLAVFALAMFGFGFAMVPYYKALCQVAGLTDLLRADAAPVNTQVDTARWITLELDANTHGMPWRFVPLQRSVRIHPGQMTQIEFEIRNDGRESMVGQAIPSYGPQHVEKFVRKLECFCFKQQALGAGETRQMPVQLVIDPALPADVTTLTLSYTFFEVQGANKAGANKAAAYKAAAGQPG